MAVPQESNDPIDRVLRREIAVSSREANLMADTHLVRPTNPNLRIAGRDRPAGRVLADAVKERGFPVQARPGFESSLDDDPALIDLSLHVEPDDKGQKAPTVGFAYAGFTPEQRRHFLTWAEDPLKPAPLAFSQLYVAGLEVNLFERDGAAVAAHRELVRLALSHAWSGNETVARAAALGFWLRQDGRGLSRFLIECAIPDALAEPSLGWLALLTEPLAIAHVQLLIRAWGIAVSDPSSDVLRMRLSSLTEMLGEEPLAYVLGELPEESRNAPKPWRCAHRSLRLALPQPPIRRVLEPLLTDMLAIVDVASRPSRTNIQPADDESEPDTNWQLILEFGQSRSDFFEHVLKLCQRVPGFTQLMDENRNMVYRLSFRKRDMRRFWQIWDYVQNWSTTRVYLNGEEIEKWKVWPYSQFLR